MTTLIEQFRQSSPLFGGNAPFIEDLYEQYLQDPNAVPDNWREYFRSLQSAEQDTVARDVAHTPIRESFARLAKQAGFGSKPISIAMDEAAAEKQASVLRMINAFRTRGHQAAHLDPLALRERPLIADLDPMFHGLTEADMDTEFNTGSLQINQQMKLRDIMTAISSIYTGTIGSEYMHITKTEEKRWIQKRLESTFAQLDLSAEEKKQLLRHMIAADGLEKYLHTKYVGQKRFSLEGGDSLIPLMDTLIQRGGAVGAKEIVIGMAHRGRLNVLVNIIGKSPAELFQEFEGKKRNAESSSGDVKYHQGFSSDVETPGGAVHLALAFNPSHLEIVNPVVEGSVRARLERRKQEGGETPFDEVMPILVHGDAAFAGQGVVMETMQLSQVRGYRTGGTIHVVVNNQIGFTTSNPLDARSSLYCTDVAKILQAPIFHVNGDDPEAVLFVSQLALDYRMEFHKDVVIDLVCYRRLGHNEADEPSATQPMMYKSIKGHKTPAALYADRLIEEGLITTNDFRTLQEQYRTDLDNGKQVSRPMLEHANNPYAVDWTNLKEQNWDAPAATAVGLDIIQQLSEQMLALPEGFELNPRVAKIMDDRRKMAAGALALDWGFAENMAYACLLHEGFKVRISGQDCGRGTFFHRHAVAHNQKDGTSYVPLKNLPGISPSKFIVIDSILSEEAVLGFEYGFSTAEPHALTIWEAQFGDFTNGAQVVIDQFITSGEAKWGRLCGLTLLLPHGYEGQGPEHSSARLERFLQLCAEHNIQVCVPSTPAQAFHMLRRQMVRPFRKPLIVMSPKSLLRHRLAVNALEDLSQGEFNPILDEIDPLDPDKVSRIVFCSGKVYYDLLETRREHNIEDVALVRIEQLYPFPMVSYEAELARYTKVQELVWCQEEPRNQGAWYQILHHLREPLGNKQDIEYAGRPASASPAVGYYGLHVEQQRTLIEHALKITHRSE